MHFSKKFLVTIATASIILSTNKVQAVNTSQATIVSAFLEHSASCSNTPSRKNMLRLLSILSSEAFLDYINHSIKFKTLEFPNDKFPDHLKKQAGLYLIVKTIELLTNTQQDLYDLSSTSHISLFCKAIDTKEALIEIICLTNRLFNQLLTFSQTIYKKE